MEVEVADAAPAVVLAPRARPTGPSAARRRPHSISTSRRRRGTSSGRPATSVSLHRNCRPTNSPAKRSMSSGPAAVSTCRSDGPSIRSRITPERPSTVRVPCGRATGKPASASRVSTDASKRERPFQSGRSSLSTLPSPWAKTSAVRPSARSSTWRAGGLRPAAAPGGQPRARPVPTRREPGWRRNRTPPIRRASRAVGRREGGEPGGHAGGAGHCPG